MHLFHEVKEWLKLITFALLLFALIVGVFTALFLQPYFEARTFNKFTTGPKATYWDAVWGSLRVTPQ